MASCDYATVIKVSEDLCEGGYFVLDSDDLPGFLLCGKDLAALRKDTPEGIKLLFRENYGMDVSVHPVDGKRRFASDPASVTPDPAMVPQTWTAVPRHAAA